MSKKAKVEIIETTNKNVKVGDKFGVNILTKQGRTSKRKGTGGSGSGKRKPRQPTLREIVLDLAKDVKQIKNDIVNLKENDEKIFDVLKRNKLK
jgi:hypothetical protein